MKIISQITNKEYHTNVVGLSRSLLAFGTLLTLLFNNNQLLFFYGVDFDTRYIGQSPFTLFGLFTDANLMYAKLIAIAVLLVVILGYYPRFMGILHWYITYSFLSDCPIVDGGDQIASQITLILIPITLLDSRKSHWNKPRTKNYSPYLRIVTYFAFFLLHFQIAFIYFDAAVSKIRVEEWINGTAVYYWFTSPTFGVGDFLQPLIYPLLKHPITLTLITWSTIALELTLAGALFMKYTKSKILLFLGLAFHFMIILIHGLPSFFCTMSACLVIYLLPSNYHISSIKIAEIFSKKNDFFFVFKKKFETILSKNKSSKRVIS
ncbi:sporulation-delaying protein SdpB family protein [Aquimarina pacifica]|uniref:sporulation-delaying protein SdpB family protein n=1 Tax=Aquimarina pacifica TaxID=1296415 RepID=UPI00046F493C|nr:sporulation-delaying protein SdpB family protein [Aquimarina pacifica]